jgi:hypothetical protein
MLFGTSFERRSSNLSLFFDDTFTWSGVFLFLYSLGNMRFPRKTPQSSTTTALDTQAADPSLNGLSRQDQASLTSAVYACDTEVDTLSEETDEEDPSESRRRMLKLTVGSYIKASMGSAFDTLGEEKDWSLPGLTDKVNDLKIKFERLIDGEADWTGRLGYVFDPQLHQLKSQGTQFGNVYERNFLIHTTIEPTNANPEYSVRNATEVMCKLLTISAPRTARSGGNEGHFDIQSAKTNMDRHRPSRCVRTRGASSGGLTRVSDVRHGRECCCGSILTPSQRRIRRVRYGRFIPGGGWWSTMFLSL